MRTRLMWIAAAAATLITGTGAAAAGVPVTGVIGADVQALDQQDVDDAVQRCVGMSLLLRDRVSGEGLPLGPADGPGVPVPVPTDEPERFALECFDGYVVVLDEDPLAGAAVEAEQDAAIAAIGALVPGAEVVRRFTGVLNALVVRTSLEGAEALREAGYEVHENVEVRSTLQDSIPLINADEARSGGVTGKGTTIAIVDTGVDHTHPDFGSDCFGHFPPLAKESTCKVIGGYDFVNKDPVPIDDHGHGTHVAAIAAGVQGVAPDAKLYAFKVLNAQGWGTLDDVIAGIERSVDPNGDGSTSDAADVINLSFGASGGSPEDPLALAVDGAVAAGSVVTVSAGNATWRDMDEANILTPGVARRAITVGASTKADWVAYFSSRGPVRWGGRAIVKPDVVAPGEDICAARSGAWRPEFLCDPAGRRVTASGTSMAAPHVAGVAALLEQAHPELSPDDVKAVLKGSAVPLQGGPSVVAMGAGRVDATAALAQADLPPVALLDPIALTGEVRQIRGVVRASGLREWSLSYAPYRAAYIPETVWTQVHRSTTPPSGADLYTLATARVPDGRYIVRLTVEDTRGRRGVDYGYTEIDKIRFARPLDFDVERAGGVLPVEVKVDVPLSGPEFVLEHALEANTPAWTETGRGSTPPQVWDTQGLQGGAYLLRLTVTHDGITEREQVRPRLDPRLAEGWPVRVPLGMKCWWTQGPCSIAAGWADPVVDDLDGDGTRELVFMRHAPIPELRAYDEHGAELWRTPVGTKPSSEYWYAVDALHAPVVGDVDADGLREVLVYNVREQRLYVVGAGGAVERALDVPVGASAPIWPRLILADVNADGSQEAVLSVHAGREKILVVRPTDGAKLAEWLVTTKTGGAYFIYSEVYGYAPAVGNLDADPELEIVAIDAIEGKIHAFDWPGQELPGWPVSGNPGGRPNAAPAIGDVDADGRNEVVAAVVFGKSRVAVHVVEADGSSLPGWPLLMDNRTLFGAPSLADLDGVEGLEVLVPLESALTAYHHDGVVLPGWPVAAYARGDYQAVVADVSGDGRADVVLHENKGGPGRLLAWGAGGSPLPGFGMPIERSGRAPVAVTSFREGGSTVVVAASDSDFVYDAGNRFISKGRLSLYVWDLGVPVTAAPWPMYQHDPARTGSAS